jgi:hypothetical protein
MTKTLTITATDVLSQGPISRVALILRRGGFIRTALHALEDGRVLEVLKHANGQELKVLSSDLAQLDGGGWMSFNVGLDAALGQIGESWPSS